MRPRRLLFACLVLGVAELAHGQLPSTPTLVVPSQAERIEVDLVVRDRQGELIRDLDPAEVEVRENGVRQEIESFAFVAGGARGGLAARPTFLALAFDRLGPATRRLAREAALGLLSRELPPASEMGVFSVDARLAVVQPFSADRPALRRALEGASSLAPTSLASQRQREMTRNAYHGLGEGFGQAHVAAAEQKGAPECRAPSRAWPTRPAVSRSGARTTSRPVSPESRRSSSVTTSCPTRRRTGASTAASAGSR